MDETKRICVGAISLFFGRRLCKRSKREIDIVEEVVDPTQFEHVTPYEPDQVNDLDLPKYVEKRGYDIA